MTPPDAPQLPERISLGNRDDADKREPELLSQGYSLWIENGKWFANLKIDPEKFGPHDYALPGSRLGDCRCGCWMGDCRSYGPVDPFGACPANPIEAVKDTPAMTLDDYEGPGKGYREKVLAAIKAESPVPAQGGETPAKRRFPKYPKWEHSMSCPYPEGCNCGASPYNRRLTDIDTLERELADLRKKERDWQDARMEGRRECIAILVEMDAETGLDDCIGNHPIGDTGEYGAHWEVEKLRELFDADERQSINERAEGAYWEVMGEMIGLQDALTAAQQDSKRLREKLKSSMTRWEARECRCNPDRRGTICHRCLRIQESRAEIDAAMREAAAAGRKI